MYDCRMRLGGEDGEGKKNTLGPNRGERREEQRETMLGTD
jgi:hypothetical protein